MERPLFVVAVLTMIGAAAVFGQSAPSPSTSEGLELLNQAAQRYADAKSYYIESVEERTSSTEYSHSWQKTVITAAEAPEKSLPLRGSLKFRQCDESSRREDCLDLSRGRASVYSEASVDWNLDPVNSDWDD